jgi:hypothetical protein
MLPRSIASRGSALSQPASGLRAVHAKISGRQHRLYTQNASAPATFTARPLRRSAACKSTAEDDAALVLTPDTVVVDEFFEVEKVIGVRASLEGEDPIVEYRVKWKDGRPDTWCVLARAVLACFGGQSGQAV